MKIPGNTVTMMIVFILLTSAIPRSVCAQTDIKLADAYPIIHKGDYDKAISFLRRYNIQHKDRVDGILLLGQLYLSKGYFTAMDYAEAVFREGLRREPENTVLLQYLADLNRKKGMIEHAQYYLKRSIAVDPNNPEALEQLMITYILREDGQGLKEILEKVHEWSAAHPDSIRGYVTLGKIYLAMGKGKEAIEILRKGLAVDLTHPPLHRTLAEAYLGTGNLILFTESYYFWLSTTKDPEYTRMDFQLAEFAMSEEDQLEFRNTAPSRQAEWLVSYWRRQDPNPVTIQNERLVEHFQRVAYSRQHFRTPIGSLGFDDRGKIYIRWGPPEEKYSNPMPILSPGYDDKFSSLAASSNLVGGEAITPAFGQTMGLRGNESWYYPSIDYYMGFDFVNYGGYYQEAASLTDAVIGRSSGIGMGVMDDDYANWHAIQSMYMERVHLGGFYATLATRAVDDLARAAMIDVPSEKAYALRHAEPRYEVFLAIPPLDFEAHPVQFRGDSGMTRVEMAYGLPLKQLTPVPRADTTFTFMFRSDFVVFDSTNLRVLHRQFRQEKVCPPLFDYKKVSFTGETQCSLFPGSYEFTFQLLEISNKKGKYNSYPMDVRDFTGAGLAISDLKLSPEIRLLGIDEESGSERLSVLPYPFGFVMRRLPLFVYFEIYNLGLLPEGNSDYEISLKMEREVKKGEFAIEAMRSFGRIFTGGKASSIQTSYRRSGNKETSPEYIELDLSGIEPGHSRLTVRVRDLILDSEVENSVEFDLRQGEE